MKAAAALIALARSGCATVPPPIGPTAGLGEIAYTNGSGFSGRSGDAASALVSASGRGGSSFAAK